MNIQYSHGSSVLVLGAGIQGVLSALALSKAGWQVTLIDRAPAPLLGASLRGEAKLHLGYVYGNEPSRTTAGLMVEGALSFSSLIDGWLPQPLDWKSLSSAPFIYAILSDTMVSPGQLADHYQWVDDAVLRKMQEGATYGGLQTFTRSHPITDLSKAGFSGDVIAAFQTSEIALYPWMLRRELLAALHASNITILPNCNIKSVARKSQGFEVTFTTPTQNVTVRQADAVVNCLWDGRLAIDASMDIPIPRNCMYRFKYVVHASLQSKQTGPLTTTFALGPYGDVVLRDNGKLYLSWYPVCLDGIFQGLEPPASWQLKLTDPGYEAVRMDIARATVDALAKRIEMLRHVRIESVTGGVIVAWGESDIDTPDSELHQRHEIGVYDYDGYLSVDTGKFTTAPLFAARVAEILGSGQCMP